MSFRPRLVVIERAAVDTPVAQRLMARFHAQVVDRWLPGGVALEDLRAADAKSTLVVKRLDPIRFELVEELGDCLFHLARGCPLHCAYCSLTYRLPAKPYIEVFGNVEDILESLDRLRVEMGKPVRFIVGDYTDALPLEPWTGALRTVISHFATHHQGRSRLEFLTKSNAVEPLLEVDPRGTTWFGVSLNTPPIARALEHGVASVPDRLEALRSMVDAGYHPLVNIAPVFWHDGWREDYAELLDMLRDTLRHCARYDERSLRIECEAHWQKGMELPILDRMYPASDKTWLTRGKVERPGIEGTSVHVYPDPVYEELTSFFAAEIAARFPLAERTSFVPPPSPHYRANKVAPR